MIDGNQESGSPKKKRLSHRAESKGAKEKKGKVKKGILHSRLLVRKPHPYLNYKKESKEEGRNAPSEQSKPENDYDCFSIKRKFRLPTWMSPRSQKLTRHSLNRRQSKISDSKQKEREVGQEKRREESSCPHKRRVAKSPYPKISSGPRRSHGVEKKIQPSLKV